MIDGIIKADGTSRLMKSELPATYEEFRAQCHAGTQPLDVLFNALGWSQLPTFLNKANLLKDDTANLFGLGNNVVIDALFSWIGQYNTHWWSVLHGQAGFEYQENLVAYDSNDSAMFADGSATRSITYAKSVSVDKTTGAVTLVNPQTISIDGSSLTSINTLIAQAPVYVTNLFTYGTASDTVPNKIYYLPSGTTASGSSSSTIHYASKQLYINGYATVKAYTVTSKIINIPAGETTYVHSTDRNAYPDSGTVDGLTYEYLGIPFQNAVTAPRIVTGTYTGTGTSGKSNAVSLSFDFEPKFVICHKATTSGGFTVAANSGEGFRDCLFMMPDVTAVRIMAASDSRYRDAYVSFNGNTVSYYAQDGYPGSQLNTSGAKYRWVAFG